MRKKYPDCQREDGVCAHCSYVNYGRDCHNNRITPLEWHRQVAGMTQKEVADASGINIRNIQKIESGQIDIGNITAKNLMALANALDVEPGDLM